jgi:DNA replication initiation complex subunit (GINS family)
MWDHPLRTVHKDRGDNEAQVLLELSIRFETDKKFAGRGFREEPHMLKQDNATLLLVKQFHTAEDVVETLVQKGIEVDEAWIRRREDALLKECGGGRKLFQDLETMFSEKREQFEADEAEELQHADEAKAQRGRQIEGNTDDNMEDRMDTDAEGEMGSIEDDKDL